MVKGHHSSFTARRIEAGVLIRTSLQLHWKLEWSWSDPSEHHSSFTARRIEAGVLIRTSLQLHWNLEWSWSAFQNSLKHLKMCFYYQKKVTPALLQLHSSFRFSRFSALNVRPQITLFRPMVKRRLVVGDRCSFTSLASVSSRITPYRKIVFRQQNTVRMFLLEPPGQF